MPSGIRNVMCAEHLPFLESPAALGRFVHSCPLHVLRTSHDSLPPARQFRRCTTSPFKGRLVSTEKLVLVSFSKAVTKLSASFMLPTQPQ